MTTSVVHLQNTVRQYDKLVGKWLLLLLLLDLTGLVLIASSVSNASSLSATSIGTWVKYGSIVVGSMTVLSVAGVSYSLKVVLSTLDLWMVFLGLLLLVAAFSF